MALMLRRVKRTCFVIFSPFSLSWSSSLYRTSKDLSKLCEKGQSDDAIQVINFGIITRNDVYCLLQACEKRKDMDHGRRVQFLMIYSGLDKISALADHLIRLFAYHEAVFEANAAFDKIAKPTVYTFTAIVSTHTRAGDANFALKLYHGLELSGLQTESYVYLSILKACSMTSDLLQGRLIHCQIITCVLHLDTVLGNTILDMYAKCGSLEEACNCFQRITNLDVVSWAAMISGYVYHGEGTLALELLEKMQHEGMKPTNATFLSAAKACTSKGAVEEGRLVHVQIIKAELQVDMVVGSALVDMYAKCGCLEEASKVFCKFLKGDVILWSAIIAGYAQHGEGFIALEHFYEMQRQGITPNSITFLSVLKACINIRDLIQGRLMHYQILKLGMQLNVVTGNTILDMYAKCGSMEDAEVVFNRLLTRDVISWSVMIAGYVEHGQGILALDYFERMQHECKKPSINTFLSALKACALIGAIEHGRLIHYQIIEVGVYSENSIGTVLIDMYSKSGSLEEACKVFESLRYQDVALWGAMVAGYAQHGKSLIAVECFENMHQEGIRPDVPSFTRILLGCSHAGLVDESYWYFRYMKIYFGIEPTMPHYACLVDLLGQVGRLKEAGDLLCASGKPNLIVWTSLLSACRRHANMEVAETCFKQIMSFDSECASTYVLMSNFYADDVPQESLFNAK